jgi:hypothetical protein
MAAYVPPTKRYVAVLDESEKSADTKETKSTSRFVNGSASASASAYVPPVKRNDGWVKSVKVETKKVSIESMSDFPSLGKSTIVSTSASIPVGGAGLSEIAKPLTLAEKLRKKQEEEEKLEQKKKMEAEVAAKKAAKEAIEYSSIQARSLHRKLFRDYGSYGDEFTEEQTDEYNDEYHKELHEELPEELNNSFENEDESY